MDRGKLANYAYHNLEFLEAIELSGGAASEDTELAVIQLKCLCELDRTKEAVAFGEHWSHAQSGELAYWLGVASYLNGDPTSHIEQHFVHATTHGFSGSSLGLAFLAFGQNRTKDGMELLNRCRPESDEMEHIRLLMLFQGNVIVDELQEAERFLKIADKVLQKSPSLLRSHWGSLCWVRLLRSKGRFEPARVVLERLFEQLDPARTPRLYRNASHAMELIHDKDDSAEGLTFPKGAPLFTHSKIASITRKPMLNSLFQFLMVKGDHGASKEEIVESVWQESYNPMVHDDRIYKAVGRLRRLLGDDIAAPNILTQQGRQYVLHL